jgi:hypothetical protein
MAPSVIHVEVTATFDRGTPGPYAIACPIHGRVFLTEADYDAQMARPDSHWECPAMDSHPDRFGPCGAPSAFDDDNYEHYMDGDREDDDKPGAFDLEMP